eukprot:SAG31_NODE_3854_length_3816_cov_1.250471_2_plen_526_part_01
MNLAGFAGEMGDLAGAKQLTEKAHERQIAKLGPDHPDVLLTAHNKRRLHILHDRAMERVRRRSSAISTASSAGSTRSRRLSAMPPTDATRDFPTPRTCLWKTALELQAVGELDEAENVFMRVAEQDETRADHCLYHVAVMHEMSGNYESADQLYGAVELRRLEALGTASPPDQLLLRARMGIVNILAHFGHHEVAEELCTEVAKLQSEHLGADHPDTLRSHMNLAGFAGDRGDLAAARKLIELVHTQQGSSLGPDHPDVLLTRYNMGCLLADEGNHAEAEAVCQAVVAAQAAALGPNHPEVFRLQSNLSELLETGDYLVVPPPPHSEIPLGTLRLELMCVEMLRPTRTRQYAAAVDENSTAIKIDSSNETWEATNVLGERILLTSEHTLPYIACAAGAGMVQRSETASFGLAKTPRWTSGESSVHERESVRGGVLEFRVTELPDFLRLYCFDSLDSNTEVAIAERKKVQALARRCDTDAIVGAGEAQWPIGAGSESFEELQWVALHFPVGGDAWTPELSAEGNQIL